MEVRETGGGRGRFELNEGDGIVFADYRRDGPRLEIWHVEAPPHLRGTGAAGRLMQEVMEHVRAGGMKVVPYCGYAAAWIRRHPDFRPLAER